MEIKIKKHGNKENAKKFFKDIKEKMKKEDEPVTMLTEDERLAYIAKAKEEFAAKEEKKVEKVRKKIEARLNNGFKSSNEVKELIDSGVITIEDLYDPITLERYSFLDILEKYQESPQEDESETESEETKKETTPNLNDIHEVNFMNQNNFSTEQSENVENISEDTPPINPVNGVLFTDDIKDKILNNDIIKEIYPDITPENIKLENGMILMMVDRSTDKEGNKKSEIFRFDIVEDKIFVQAPINGEMTDNSKQNVYKYVSVPIDTEVGKKILMEENYVVNVIDIDINTALFRPYENAI